MQNICGLQTERDNLSIYIGSTKVIFKGLMHNKNLMSRDMEHYILQSDTRCVFLEMVIVKYFYKG